MGLSAYCRADVLIGKEIEGDPRLLGNQIDFWVGNGARIHAHLRFDVFETTMMGEYDVVEQRNLYAQLRDFQNFLEALHHQFIFFDRIYGGSSRGFSVTLTRYRL